MLAYKNIPSESRNHQIRKRTKEEAKTLIEKNGFFHGYICGSNIQTNHIAQSWNYGEEIFAESVEAFLQHVKDIEQTLFSYAPDLGAVQYYQVLHGTKSRPPNKHRKRSELYDTNNKHKISKANQSTG